MATIDFATASAATLLSVRSALGGVVQVVSVVETAELSWTTTINYYNATSLPAMTSGGLILSGSITPTSSTNRILALAFYHVGYSSSVHLSAIMGRSTDTNARTGAQVSPGASRTDYAHPGFLVLDEEAGGTSAITFNVRAGSGSVGTGYLNRSSLAANNPPGLCSYLFLIEYKPQS